MNTGFAISDVVLALACGFIALRVARARPGVALACAAIGIAATIGALRFSVLPELSGAHRFLSLTGSTAALPLLAASLAWPDGQAAKTGRGAALTLLVGSALGIAVVVGAGFPLWGQAVPALSAIAILAGAVRAGIPRKFMGALILVATFGFVAAKVPLGGFEPLEVLHYGMTAALLLACL